PRAAAGHRRRHPAGLRRACPCAARRPAGGGRRRSVRRPGLDRDRGAAARAERRAGRGARGDPAALRREGPAGGRQPAARPAAPVALAHGARTCFRGALRGSRGARALAPLWTLAARTTGPMFTLSFSKILMTVAIAVIAWRGWRMYQSMQAKLAAASERATQS